MKPDTATKIFRALLAAGRKPRLFSTEQYKSVPTETTDAVVIGAGVVGIAVARELAMKLAREVLVIESAATFGTGSSSRNSEVIHAGIYYPRNSLKAAFCVRGRQLLYKYCEEHHIPHKQIGKLIVATGSSEISKLDLLMTRGIENGVEGLRMMDGHEATRMEPELQCLKALLSPASGIVDSHSFMLSLLGEAENHGATFSYNTTVTGGKYDGDRVKLYISDSQALRNWDWKSPLKPDLILSPRILVNSAGLGALALSKRIHGLDNGIIPRPYFARGCYFTLSNVRSPPFQHLIYPIPEDGGLGVHVTLDLNGQVRFGPDVEWIDGVDDISSFLNLFDYSVPGDRANRFYPEIRKYYPYLKDGSLEPGYAGIRPKLSGAKQGPIDFVIQGEEIHGIPGLINLFGIESPGLTSCLAIAEHVAARLSR
ncbi:L-2-hydroxyglutarate dehydrogenase, mitochondrial isoform X1 [Sesamum indicum]|uniref:L-2-hydroxyglutarate dehydrogenase, mitochondrial n=1 Tax=Sesamum indicum TaxID=4182 RepID=A0A6I9SYF0_SESIN|nr:L-2-hydroxyglutarate dehydrogenase, mitochondrial isoform X1 [Sesamum indicum]